MNSELKILILKEIFVMSFEKNAPKFNFHQTKELFAMFVKHALKRD